MPEHFKTGEKIGEGAQKEVYEDLGKPDQVIALRRKEYGSPDFIKARFYLTKILHLLFPKNIPDISFSITRPHADRRQRVQLHKDHKLISRRMDGPRFSDGEIEQREAARREIYQSSAYKNLVNSLAKLHIFIDVSAVNFTFDHDGNIVYFDDVLFQPESEYFDMRPAFRKAINEQLTDPERTRALKYLDRFHELNKNR